MLVLPLVLGGCGMPIGVTIASFVADAFSLATTDKTLADHGISAVTGEDCALWRGFKGDDICNKATTKPPVAVADAGTAAKPTDTAAPAAKKSAESSPVAPAPAESAAPAADATSSEAAPVVAEAPPVAAEPLPAVSESPLPEPETAKATANKSTPPGVEVAERAEPAVLAEAKAPPPPAPQTLAAAEPLPPALPTADPASGGTYLVIASYVRAADAERFARGQDSLDWLVLSGTAHGKRVFRVAIGPVAATHDQAEKGRLEKAGFADVWALHQDHPDVVAGSSRPDQVAELD